MERGGVVCHPCGWAGWARGASARGIRRAPMADVATPGAAASGALNQTGVDKDADTGKARREKPAGDGEGKREPLPADEFTKATFTAAQKVLREQRSRAPPRHLPIAAAALPTLLPALLAAAAAAAAAASRGAAAGRRAPAAPTDVGSVLTARVRAGSAQVAAGKVPSGKRGAALEDCRALDRGVRRGSGDDRVPRVRGPSGRGGRDVLCED